MHDSRAAGQPRFSGGGGGGGGRELERVFPGVSHGRSTVIGIELSLAHSLSVCLSLRAVQWAQSTGIAFLATIQGNQLSVYELVRDGAGVTSETNGIC